MAANIECKARLRDVAAAHAVAVRRSRGSAERIPQTDVFFEASGGRLKLRMLPDRAELISYQRVDRAAARRSEYRIAPVAAPEELRQTLAHALGEAGVVRKERSLYRVGQTRIHIDRVEGLGDFLEIEVVLRPDQPEAEGQAIAAGLLREFGVEPGDLIACAYVDLLREKGQPREISSKAQTAVDKHAEGYNCAQAVAFAFADECGMSPDMALKAACGFGAGMGRKQEVCGAVTGSLLVLGMRRGRGAADGPPVTQELYKDVRGFMDAFAARHGSCLCCELLPGVDLMTEEGRARFKEEDLKRKVCSQCVRSAAEIVESML